MVSMEDEMDFYKALLIGLGKIYNGQLFLSSYAVQMLCSRNQPTAIFDDLHLDAPGWEVIALIPASDSSQSST